VSRLDDLLGAAEAGALRHRELQELVCLVRAEVSPSEGPYVCPGCYAVGPERCAPGCIDAEIEAEREHDQDNPSDRRDDDEEADQ
jgi:hypothetical protein